MTDVLLLKIIYGSDSGSVWPLARNNYHCMHFLLLLASSDVLKIRIFDLNQRYLKMNGNPSMEPLALMD